MLTVSYFNNNQNRRVNINNNVLQSFSPSRSHQSESADTVHFAKGAIAPPMKLVSVEVFPETKVLYNTIKTNIISPMLQQLIQTFSVLNKFTHKTFGENGFGYGLKKQRVEDIHSGRVSLQAKTMDKHNILLEFNLLHSPDRFVIKIAKQPGKCTFNKPNSYHQYILSHSGASIPTSDYNELSGYGDNIPIIVNRHIQYCLTQYLDKERK